MNIIHRLEAIISQSTLKINKLFLSDDGKISASDAIWFYGINGSLLVLSLLFTVLLIIN